MECKIRLKPSQVGQGLSLSWALQLFLIVWPNQLLQLLFLIKRSINSPSIKKKCKPWTLLFPNKTAPYMPLGCPQEPREPPSFSMAVKKIDAVDINFSWWNDPLSASELPLRAPKRKINAVDITFSWWNCPHLPLSWHLSLSLMGRIGMIVALAWLFYVNFLVISHLIEYLSLARTEYEKRVRAQAKAMMDG